MVDTEALDLANYIIEPVGSDINAPTSFTVRKRFQGVETTTSYLPAAVNTMFDDIMDQMAQPTTSGSGMKGGLLYLNNGTYLLPDGGIAISDATDGPNVSIRIVGEARDNTILQIGAALTGKKILQPYCTLEVENISFKGNATTCQAISPNTAGNATKLLKVKNCRFNNFGDFDILIGGNQYAVECSESIFENHQVSNDQFAFECIGWARVHSNYFEKTSGVLTGESLTTGTVFNCHIYNNTVKRTTHDNGGISIEPFDVNPANENIHITGNMLINAGISVGRAGQTYTQTVKNCTIDSNALYGGGIRVLGSNGSNVGQLTNISIMNNSIFNAYEHGVKIYRCGGPIFVRNNSIWNTNTGLVANASLGAIDLEVTLDTICENNSIYMGVTSPADANFSINGIRYTDPTNLTLRNNRILNRTVANSSYVTSGSLTGTNLISRSL